ncbi:MAG: N2,N2-dimethylguanosine tRNA methyltransferase [Candidatus Thermoplasmatota archaeon]|nr:N2,N2-dimethylguanosine tRNA methyltransferase [Candidatus Thermoplasmatota archaeon]
MNRDLTISLLNTLKPKLYLDGFGATGIRALRANKETGIHSVASERSFGSFRQIVENAKRNDSGIEIYNESFESTVSKFKFDFIDVDPYGSIVPFVDVAINYVKNHGYIGFTATDLSVLSGSLKEKNSRRYGSVVLNNSLRHEMGIRNLLGFIGRRASNLDCGIEPMISIWHGHYYRVIVRVNKSVKDAIQTLNKIDSVNMHSFKDTVYPDRNIGPIWMGKMNGIFEEREIAFPNTIDETTAAFINKLKNEDMETFFTDLSESLSSRKINLLSTESVIRICRENGIKVERTHFSPTGFKSGNSPDCLNAILRYADSKKESAN